MSRTLMYAVVPVEQEGSTWKPVQQETPTLGTSVVDAMRTAHANPGETFGVWMLTDAACVYEVARHKTRTSVPDFVAITVKPPN